MLTSIEKHLIAFVCGALSCALLGTPGLIIILIFPLFIKGIWPWLATGVGFLWAAVFLHIQMAIVLPENMHAAQGQYLGRISDVKPDKEIAQFRFDVLDGELQGKALAVNCYRCTLDFHTGQVWRFTLNVRPFRNFYNPGGQDYRERQALQGLAGSAYVRNPEDAVLYAIRPELREFFTHEIYTVIYGSTFEPHVKSMLLALLTGDKSMLGNDLYKLLVSAGLIHLFVVSGLHISLIFTLVFFVVQALLRVGWILRFPVQPLAVVFASSAAVFYGFITGLEVPALRAVFSVCCISWLAWQMGNITLFRLWVLACVFVLLLKPVAFIGLGAQLSFGVVLAFVWVLSGRKTLWLRSFILLQFAAFSAGAILLAAANLPVPLAGLLLNMVFIPLVSLLVLPLAVLHLLMSVCGIELGGLTWLLNELLSIPLGLLAGQSWPVLQVPHLKFWPFVACLLLLIVPRFLGARPIGIMALAVLLLAPIPSPSGWRLHVFDVGQGSAQLVQVAGRNILIDTGDRYLSGTRVADFTIVPALRYLGVEQLDMLLVTHHDADHSGGVDSILEEGLLQGPVLNEDNCQGAQWRIAMVSFQILQVQGLNGNNHSCVLSIESPYGSALLPGDVERKSELLLASQLAHRDVLLVPHHGSKTSSSAVFLDKVSPNIAIISAGAANRYGHPHKDVLTRLYGRDIHVLSTASHGTVSLSFSPRQAGPSVSTYRPDFYPLVEE